MEIDGIELSDDDEDGDFDTTKMKTPFLYLSLELPAAPLFKETQDRSLIPQVYVYNMMNEGLYYMCLY